MNMRNGKRIRRDAVGDWEAWNIRSVDGKRIERIAPGGGVSREDLVVVPKVVIEPEAALIVVVAAHLRGLVDGWGDIPEGIKIPGGQPKGTEHKAGNLVAREGLACKFVNQRHGLASAWIGQAGEVSGALGGRGYNSRLRLALTIALALVVQEEEILVAPQRAAGCRSTLIQVQRLTRPGESVC